MGLTAAQIAAILAAGLTSGPAIPKAILGKKLAKTIIEAIKKYLKEHNQGDNQTDNSGTQGTEDGKYGPGTAQAVVEFIEKYGDEFGLTMCPYGENGELTYVDEKTLAAMYEVAKREGPAIIQANYNGPTGGLDLDGSTVQNKNDWLEWAVAQNGFKETINPGDSEGNNNTPFGLFTSSNGGAWCAF